MTWFILFLLWICGVIALAGGFAVGEHGHNPNARGTRVLLLTVLLVAAVLSFL